ncbi:response regulator transcription factor [Yersinia hibernica]|uniref:Helix-turn-helix transcriptional regulator n=1 Tax=Yersinia enterocolitica LC20 TaxID=1443113 RepID=A0A7U4K147_YEREN|nr:LuxR C-terminal-related transcriptional regulator [Yersinia hibernica]AHM73838.1 helix-turn-helix transcriptional regulator [Yersinia hibernica]OVZ79067.1 helix-turn-helix transcriptional regulator [Yersinia kristensenii]
MRVIVISDCGLTKLSLDIIIKGIKLIVDEGRNIDSELYYSVDNKDIYNQSNARDIIIFDVDNICVVKIFHTISQIREASPLASIVVFCRKDEQTEDFIYFSIISDEILCKTAPIERIENLIIKLLSSHKPPMEFNQAELTKKIKRKLTSRENEVLEYILLGLTNGDISAALGIKNKTASAHRRNIYSKLGVKAINQTLKNLFILK